MLWLLYSIFEIFIWDYRIREAITSNPVVHLTASALNDAVWIPVALALPVYIGLLASRLLQRYLLRSLILFFFIVAALVAITNVQFYFRIIWLLSVIFVSLWIVEIKKTRQIRVSLLCFFVALSGLFIKYNSQILPQFPQLTPRPITLMSFNFNTQGALDDKRTVHFIREKMPDIVFLQEFTAREKRYVLSKLSDVYPYSHLPSRGYGKNDVMILSRLPIEWSDQVRLKTAFSPHYDSANHAIIDYHGENIHLLNCHLSHPVRFIPKVFSQSDSNRYFYRLLKNADKHHRAEAKILADYARQLDGPVIIAGDFNDTPNSFVYSQFSSAYQNAFAQAGRGVGATFGEWTLRQKLPPVMRALALDYLRIDHVFCSDDLKIIDAQVAPLDAFDHRPQMVTLELKR